MIDNTETLSHIYVQRIHIITCPTNIIFNWRKFLKLARANPNLAYQITVSITAPFYRKNHLGYSTSLALSLKLYLLLIKIASRFNSQKINNIHIGGLFKYWLIENRKYQIEPGNYKKPIPHLLAKMKKLICEVPIYCMIKIRVAWHPVIGDNLLCCFSTLGWINPLCTC